MKKRVLSGIQPSGRLHLGNYLGAMKQHIAAQDVADRECYYFIANYHSLTSLRDRDQLRELSIDVARTYFVRACQSPFHSYSGESGLHRASRDA